uniref:GxxExxY protein n=1 Tax=Brugia timori TaxID=42155 RepID=A0A0R3RBH0_9BILA
LIDVSNRNLVELSLSDFACHNFRITPVAVIHEKNFWELSFDIFRTINGRTIGILMNFLIAVNRHCILSHSIKYHCFLLIKSYKKK